MTLPTPKKTGQVSLPRPLASNHAHVNVGKPARLHTLAGYRARP